MKDLNNQDEAKILIEGLIPDPVMRQICLHIFMDAIDEANFYGSDQWYIEPAFDGHVWLITGSLVTCSLVEDRIWLSLDRQLLTSQAGNPLIYDGSATDWDWEPVDLDDPTWVHAATVIPAAHVTAAGMARTSHHVVDGAVTARPVHVTRTEPTHLHHMLRHLIHVLAIGHVLFNPAVHLFIRAAWFTCGSSSRSAAPRNTATLSRPRWSSKRRAVRAVTSTGSLP